MKIAILTSGILPVPAVKGGAVENLIDFYLEYNEQHRQHDITIYSIYDEAVHLHPALQSHVNHYHYVKTQSLAAKIRKYFFLRSNQHNGYYHHTVEFFLHEAIKDIRHRHFDVIILENRPGYALKLKSVTDAKLVYHLHNDNLSVGIPHYQAIYDAVSGIITVSDYIKSRVRTINPKDTKTNTVHNCINLTAFSKAASLNRQDFGLSKNDFVIVFSGRINPEKGIMELIGAVLLLNDIKNIKLLVIGSSFYGSDINDNDFIKSLKTNAASLKDRIHFTGFVPYNDMPYYLKLGDIAVLPSIWEEPFGLTILEAMASGLPLITTRSGGIPEICEDVAVLVNRDHVVENLTAAIQELYQHPEKRKAMSLAALERSKYFSKERYARDFFKALETIATCN